LVENSKMKKDVLIRRRGERERTAVRRIARKTAPARFVPSYVRLCESGELAARAERARTMLRACMICPHECRVNRLEGERGRCRSGAKPIVSSNNVHMGEEPPLVGTGGSGTIFFTNCTLRCVYCQNYPISQLGVGRERAIDELAGMFLDLQRRGCHNVNFVTPTHFVPQILEALVLATQRGFRLPLVYNTSGYEQLETLRLLDGVIDIYLPDIRYADNAVAIELSGAEHYVEHNRAALREMYRQVGELRCDERGVAQRGLIVRHLVLPGGRAGSDDSLRFLARQLSPRLHLALMSQYFPAYKAPTIDGLNGKISRAEYCAAVQLVKDLGFDGWIQPLDAEES
jgi:putative pyruvate formate lyase activating enzyme